MAQGTIGLDVAETSRVVAFCGHAIVQDQLTVVSGALADERFATTLSRDGTLSAAELLSRADQEMYLAKPIGPARHVRPLDPANGSHPPLPVRDLQRPCTQYRSSRKSPT